MDPTPLPDLPALYRAAVETGDAAELVDLAEECGLLSTEGCSALTATMRVGRILGGVLRADQPVAGFRLHRHHHGVSGNVSWLEEEQLALP